LLTLHCSWLFGRGASIANGLSWLVPDKWKQDLIENRITREAHINMIIKTVRDEIQKPSVHCRTYRRLLNLMAQSTGYSNYHNLITTNWDYLLQLEVNAWIKRNQPGHAPHFLGTHVYHLNGTVEPSESINRSPFLLETYSASYRKQSYEANKAFNSLLWSSLVVIIGMSFECDSDNGLLAALHANEDNIPLGEALFVVIDPCGENLDNVGRKLSQYFPRAGQQLMNCGLDEWIDSDMLELKGRILTPSSK